ncbi:hypothetical protein HOLleu_35797 [Holothuria leucospilota]|uniref:Uncharacterized protein n=1 Tax=Holothuria leucospilota TaxID=206669 RepID=A0A9Q1BFB1_HOLLE|nr:hypothetical protein HOLleu_35797 [Holothuria leucospilota]
MWYRWFTEWGNARLPNIDVINCGDFFFNPGGTSKFVYGLSCMMNPPSEEVILGNQQHPSAALETFFNPTGPEGKLWGSNVRRRTGIIQIVCRRIEFVLGIAVIFVSANYSNHTDNVGWGVWTGVFAIVTGFLGVYSVKKRCVVSNSEPFACREWYGHCLHDHFYYHYDTVCGCVSYAVLDAHFGRVYYTTQPSSQQYASPPPYTMVASQNDITSKTTTSSLNGAVLLQEV